MVSSEALDMEIYDVNEKVVKVDQKAPGEIQAYIYMMLSAPDKIQARIDVIQRASCGCFAGNAASETSMQSSMNTLLTSTHCHNDLNCPPWCEHISGGDQSALRLRAF